MPTGHPYPIPLQPVLIIDDVQSEAMTIAMLCQAMGVETLRTTSVAEAGAILMRMRPSAIITDLIMPGADGLDCLFMISEQAPTVPVMVVTAAEKLLLKAAGELGGTYGLNNLVCIAKPVDLEALRDFIASAGIPLQPPRTWLH